MSDCRLSRSRGANQNHERHSSPLPENERSSDLLIRKIRLISQRSDVRLGSNLPRSEPTARRSGTVTLLSAADVSAIDGSCPLSEKLADEQGRHTASGRG